MIEILRRAWAWVQPWVQRNVTFGLVLAIATEAPRWVFAFVGAHEPVWAGVAVAVLMAFAAAQGWDEYFHQRDTLLLAMLLGQITSAMIIITPVVFAMAMGAGHEVQIRDIVASWFLWVWAGTLVVSTFLPLVIVAYVEVRRGQRVPAKGAKVRDTHAQPIVQPLPVSVQPMVHEETSAVHSEVVTVHDGAPDPSDAKAYARWLHMEKGATIAQLSAQYGVHRNTVSKWIK